jgi:hypothetical protein
LENPLEIGIAQAEITPLTGLPLGGFIFRENKPSTGVEAPISVQVLALRQKDEIFFLVSYELLGISRSLEKQILNQLQKGLGASFADERCVLTATHNHSAPIVCPLEGEVDPDPAYLQWVCDQTVRAAKEAVHRLADTSLHMGSIRIPGLTYNRRAVLADGAVSMALAPTQVVLERGPVDDTFTALVFRSPEGENQAVIVHFACHGAAVCSQQIQGDIPGEVIKRVAEIFNAPCIYLQGSAGDINPLAISADRESMLAWVDRLTPFLKELPALLHPVAGAPLQFLSTNPELFFEPLPDRSRIQRNIRGLDQIAGGDIHSEEVQPTLELLRDLMNFKPGESPDPAKAAFCAAALANAERRSLAALDSGRPLPPCPLRVTIWKMGQVGLVFVAAELFAITGFQIRALGIGTALLPVTYAAPIVGYIPDRQSMQKGGYEVKDSWRFYRQPAPFAKNTEQRLVEHIRAIIEHF